MQSFNSLITILNYITPLKETVRQTDDQTKSVMEQQPRKKRKVHSKIGGGIAGRYQGPKGIGHWPIN